MNNHQMHVERLTELQESDVRDRQVVVGTVQLKCEFQLTKHLTHINLG